MKRQPYGIYIVVVLLVAGIIGYAFMNNPGKPLEANRVDLFQIPTEGTASAAPSVTVVATTTDATSTEPITNINKPTMHTITLETNKGTIVFETYDNDAPKAVSNFINLTNKGFYDGIIFHRVIEGFMIQGGDPTGTGRGGPGYQFEDELNPNTPSGKKGYVRGTVAMANAGPNTNGSQFFIVHKDAPLPLSYTIFGHVVKGMEVVDAIATSPTDGNDKPLEAITIKKATVSPKN